MSTERVGFEEFLRRTLADRMERQAVAPPPRFRLEREMAAAAASGDRVLEGRWEDPSGSVVTEVAETDDNRLRIVVSSSDPSVVFVRLRWALVDETGVVASRRLVTPLAPGHASSTAGYDVGSVDSADAVDVEPGAPLDASEVTVDDVDAAFAVEQLGSARRAWEQVCDHPSCPLFVAERVRSLLVM